MNEANQPVTSNSTTATQPGKLILLNGPSSAGKSTLCAAIQAAAPVPFVQFSLDFFLFKTDFLPKRRDAGAAFSWPAMRPQVFAGFINCLPALLTAGNNLVVEFIIETGEQYRALTQSLHGLDVFLVGLHCPPEELERRERERGDRRIGDALRDLETVHSFTRYDFEVDSSLSASDNAERIVRAWQVRTRPGVMDQAS
jgi:chloramphenicol 3-O phosphotransferase